MSSESGNKSSIPVIQMQENSGRHVDENSIVYNILELINRLTDTINVSLKDQLGRPILGTGFGQMRTAEKISQINGQFGYNLPLSEAVIETTGNGEIVIEDSMLIIRNSDTGDGTASIESIQALRYIAGSMAVNEFTAAGIPVGEEWIGTEVTIGNFDDEDGFAIGSIDGVPFVMKRRYNGPGNIETIRVFQDDWNVDKLDGTGPSGLTFDFMLGNVYELSWIYLGFGPITFSIFAPDGSIIPFHRIEYPNSESKTHISLPYLPVRTEIDNTGSGKQIEIKIGSLDAGIYDGGGCDVTRRYRGFNGATESVVPKTVTGTQYLIAFKSADTLNGRKNKLSSLLNLLTFITDGAQPVLIEMIFNPTVITPGTWTRVDGKSEELSETPVEWSIDTVFDLTTGESSGLLLSLPKVGNINMFVDQLDSLLRRTEIAMFKTTVPSGTGTIVGCGLGYFDLY